jgi:hypothetical protein
VFAKCSVERSCGEREYPREVHEDGAAFRIKIRVEPPRQEVVAARQMKSWCMWDDVLFEDR